MYESVVKKNGNNFYAVEKQSIIKIQKDMGIMLPDDLKAFYEEIGYGFLESRQESFNRIMAPGSICDFRFREEEFADNPELEVYAAYERDKLVFFEVCEGYYLLIGFSKNNNGKIFDGDKMIADNLKQFLIEYQKDENYYK